MLGRYEIEQAMKKGTLADLVRQANGGEEGPPPAQAEIDHAVSQVVGYLKRTLPTMPWDEVPLAKRCHDELRMALSAVHAEGDVSRLRQEGEDPTNGPRFVRKWDPDQEDGEIDGLKEPERWNKTRSL
jgi:hypothetical protein